jgi:hypothetical protein
VNASAFTTRPAANVGFVHLDMPSGPGADPVLIGPHHTRAELMGTSKNGIGDLARVE